MVKFKPLAWDFQQFEYWLQRNKIGLWIGGIFGFMMFMVWWFRLGGMENLAGNVLYPAFLLFGCEIPIWAVLIVITIYATLGACLDSFLSPPRQDKKRALVILLILVLAFLALFFYREKVAMNTCTDFNRDGMSDQCVEKYNLGSSAATADNDQDGITNIAECKAGTSPNDPLDPGVSCTIDTNCVANQICTSGKCTGKIITGDACTASTECVSGLCLNSVCSDEVPTGGACTTNNQCVSNLCTNGICSVPAGQIGFTIEIVPG